ncbi:MAG: hypothetical protein C4314_02340 [Thermoflexus sp.]
MTAQARIALPRVVRPKNRARAARVAAVVPQIHRDCPFTNRPAIRKERSARAMVLKAGRTLAYGPQRRRAAPWRIK